MSTTSHNQSWYCDHVHKEVKLCKWKEKVFLHDPTEYNCYAFYIQCRHVANLSRRLGRDIYQKVFKTCKHDYKEVFCKANTLLFRNESLPLPEGPTSEELACEFNEFFIDKIEKIMLKVSQILADDVNLSYIENEQQT